jgi:hypothetical protein
VPTVTISDKNYVYLLDLSSEMQLINKRNVTINDVITQLIEVGKLILEEKLNATG